MDPKINVYRLRLVHYLSDTSVISAQVPIVVLVCLYVCVSLCISNDLGVCRILGAKRLFDLVIKKWTRKRIGGRSQRIKNDTGIVHSRRECVDKPLVLKLLLLQEHFIVWRHNVLMTSRHNCGDVTMYFVECYY